MEEQNNQNFEKQEVETDEIKTSKIGFLQKITEKVKNIPKKLLVIGTVAFAIIIIALVLGNGNSKNNNDNPTEVHTSYDAFTFYPLSSNTYTVAIAPEGKYYEEIVIPSTYNDGTVVEIAKEGFKDCEKLYSIKIPNTVKTIGESAFENCPLSTVKFTNSVKTVEYNAFKNTSVYSVYFEGDLYDWCSIYFKNSDASPLENFYYNVYHNNYYNMDGTNLYFNNQLVTEITLNNSTSNFRGCKSLKKVTIQSPYLYSAAFEGCTSLESVTLPEGIKEIPECAFEGCISLENINIPSSVTTIGLYAFRQCKSLTNVNIPDKVSKIYDYAFEDCTSLESVTLPNGITEISKSTFEGCSSLKNIVLPLALGTINNNAFDGCTSLESITLPHLISAIYYQAFKDCSSLKNIHYQGDKFMWNYTVTRGNEWDKNTGDYTIYCTDGNIEK